MCLNDFGELCSTRPTEAAKYFKADPASDYHAPVLFAEIDHPVMYSNQGFHMNGEFNRNNISFVTLRKTWSRTVEFLNGNPQDIVIPKSE